MNETENQEQDNMKQYYVLGAVVLVAVVVAGYMLRPKTGGAVTTPTPTTQAVVPTPTPGPITKLACDTQYYNPKIGFNQYYLSVEGGDPSTANKVDCNFTVVSTKDTKTLATAVASSPLTSQPERGGSTFRCTTKATEITPTVQTTVLVDLKDDTGATATCSAPFVFPAP